MIPTSIDGTDITGATIDGTDVQEITVDGDVVFSAVDGLPTNNLIHRYNPKQLSVSVGSTVSTLPDFVGSNDLSATGSPFRQDAINNYPSVRTDGSNDVLIGSSWSQNNWTTAFVFRARDTSTNRQRYMTDGDNTGTGWIWESENANYTFTPLGGLQNEDGAVDTSPHIVVIRYDDGAPSWNVRIDGTQVLSNNASISNPSGNYYVGAGEINNNGGITDHADANYGEILNYNTDHSNSYVSQIESYLSTEWNITI